MFQIQDKKRLVLVKIPLEFIPPWQPGGQFAVPIVKWNALRYKIVIYFMQYLFGLFGWEEMCGVKFLLFSCHPPSPAHWTWRSSHSPCCPTGILSRSDHRVQETNFYLWSLRLIPSMPKRFWPRPCSGPEQVRQLGQPWADAVLWTCPGKNA